MTWGWSASSNVRSHVKQGDSLPSRKDPAHGENAHRVSAGSPITGNNRLCLGDARLRVWATDSTMYTPASLKVGHRVNVNQRARAPAPAPEELQPNGYQPDLPNSGL